MYPTVTFPNTQKYGFVTTPGQSSSVTTAALGSGYVNVSNLPTFGPTGASNTLVSYDVLIQAAYGSFLPTCSVDVTPVLNGTPITAAKTTISLIEGEYPRVVNSGAITPISISSTDTLTFSFETSDGFCLMSTTGAASPNLLTEGESLTSSLGDTLIMGRHMTIAIIATAPVVLPSQRIVGATSGAIGWIYTSSVPATTAITTYRHIFILL